MEQEDLDHPNLGVAARTLLLAGYEIQTNHRQPTHSELLCNAPLLGTTVPLMIAITEDDEFPDGVISTISQVATEEGRSLVCVSALGGKDQIGWRDFMDSFGGPVPSWHALGPDYLHNLQIAAKNELPISYKGEAWRLFEQLVADGLEFCLARRVRRLGAAKRGSKLSDMLAQIPEGPIMIVDAKATSTTFDAAAHHLRPLAEYTRNQRKRQRGYNDVFAALLVSRAYSQDPQGLLAISREFQAEAEVPVSFMTEDVLGAFVTSLRGRPNLRIAVNWRRLFAGGLVTIKEFKADVDAVITERY